MSAAKIIAPFALIVGIVVSGWFVNSKIKRLELELALSQEKLVTTERVNEANRNTIAELEKQRKRDAEAIGKLIENTDRIRNEIRATNVSIRRLEITNEEVRDFLSLPVPADLRRLLDDQAENTDPDRDN